MLVALLAGLAWADDPRATGAVTIPWEGAQLTADLDSRAITGSWQAANSNGFRTNVLGDIGLQTNGAGNQPHLDVDGFIGYYSGAQALRDANTTAIAANMADFCKANSITPCTLSQISDFGRKKFIRALAADAIPPRKIARLFTPEGVFWSAGAEVSAQGTWISARSSATAADRTLVDNTQSLGLEATLYDGFRNSGAIAGDLRVGGSRTFTVTTNVLQICTDASDPSTCQLVNLLADDPSAGAAGYVRFSAGYYARPSNKTSISSVELRGGLEGIGASDPTLSLFQVELLPTFHVPIVTPAGASTLSMGLGFTATQPLAPNSPIDWTPEVVIGQYSWL